MQIKREIGFQHKKFVLGGEDVNTINSIIPFQKKIGHSVPSFQIGHISCYDFSYIEFVVYCLQRSDDLRHVRPRCAQELACSLQQMQIKGDPKWNPVGLQKREEHKKIKLCQSIQKITCLTHTTWSEGWGEVKKNY